MLLFLVRHGMSIWAEEKPTLSGRFQGQLNPELSEKGLHQARAVAKRLKMMGPFNALYSSDLRRALQTAEEIGREVEMEVIPDRRLREVHMGKFEGLTEKEAEEKFPQEYRAWGEEPVKNRPPEGESLNSLFERLHSFIEEVKSLHPQGLIIAVTHFSPIRAAIHLALGLDPEVSWRKIHPNFSSLTIIEFKEKEARLITFNDTCHLENKI